MSDLVVLRLLEQGLRALPGLPTIQADNTTETALPRLETYLLPAASRVSSVGDGPTFTDSGIYQVTLCYPSGSGLGDLGIVAAAIQEAFKEGWRASEGGVSVRTRDRPVLGPGFTQDGVYKRALSIRYSANLK